MKNYYSFKFLSVSKGFWFLSSILHEQSKKKKKKKIIWDSNSDHFGDNSVLCRSRTLYCRLIETTNCWNPENLIRICWKIIIQIVHHLCIPLQIPEEQKIHQGHQKHIQIIGTLMFLLIVLIQLKDLFVCASKSLY